MQLVLGCGRGLICGLRRDARGLRQFVGHALGVVDLTHLLLARAQRTGGDVIAPTAVRRVLDACPDIVIHAMYGATEGTVFSAHHLLTRDTKLGKVVPVGDALTRVRIHILDGRLTPAPTA